MNSPNLLFISLLAIACLTGCKDRPKHSLVVAASHPQPAQAVNCDVYMHNDNLPVPSECVALVNDYVQGNTYYHDKHYHLSTPTEGNPSHARNP